MKKYLSLVLVLLFTVSAFAISKGYFGLKRHTITAAITGGVTPNRSAYTISNQLLLAGDVDQHDHLWARVNLLTTGTINEATTEDTFLYRLVGMPGSAVLDSLVTTATGAAVLYFDLTDTNTFIKSFELRATAFYDSGFTNDTTLTYILETEVIVR